MSDSSNQIDNLFGGREIWPRFNEVVARGNYSKVFVLVDQNTRRDCLPGFLKKSGIPGSVDVLEVPEGEKYKNIETTLSLWRALSEKGGDRSSLLVNLGGGVITDLGGFVASTFKRGIDFIHVPTSLLAMVDASVGGKTGIDLDGLKNQVGVIRPATAVFIDPDFLSTLPKRHFYAGLAEMLKHGLIADPRHWEAALELKPEAPDLSRHIWESVQIKKHIADKDPDEKGLRKTLNFGHTLGHAIETLFLGDPDRGVVLHGEAVAAGIILESYLSSQVLGLPMEKVDQIARSLRAIFPSIQLEGDDRKAVVHLLVHDKKNRDGVVYFSLIEEIGKGRIDQVASNSLIEEAFDYYLGR